ncbi:uncharacterized protein LOC127734744 isoform X2 [Mytilus californianus]|uniref:uncharacterized protein LOC127734744 isoform X2 n=1 Tax=Mytilus californianus TaxID=6549 RepID=UPI002246DCE4|nr:uncharacterized protein LOC127734744 isoform X2 [Mytilus californianus]
MYLQMWHTKLGVFMLLFLHDVNGMFTIQSTSYTHSQARTGCWKINATLLTVTNFSFTYLERLIFDTAPEDFDGWHFWTDNRANQLTYKEGQTYADFPLDEEEDYGDTRLTYCVYGTYNYIENRFEWVPVNCKNMSYQWNSICFLCVPFYTVNTDAVMYTKEVTWRTARRMCQTAGGTLSDFNTIFFTTYFESTWAGITKFWTDYHSEKYVRELQSKPFPTDIKRENTFCVYAVYADRKLQWSTESCDARHSFPCFYKRNVTFEMHRNQVILHASVLKYVEQANVVSDCTNELYKFGKRGYFVGGYEYNLENASCRIIEYISLTHDDINRFLPSNSIDTYLYTSSIVSLEDNIPLHGDTDFITGNHDMQFEPTAEGVCLTTVFVIFGVVSSGIIFASFLKDIIHRSYTERCFTKKQTEEELQELDKCDILFETPDLNEIGIVEHSRNIPPTSVSFL